MDLLISGYISVSSVIKAKSREVKQIFFDIERKNRICSSSYHYAEKKQYEFLTRFANENKIELIYLSAEDFFSLTKTPGGVAATVGEKKFITIDKLLEQGDKKGFYLAVDGVEDPYNLGYLLRTAHAFGCDGVIMPERDFSNGESVMVRSSAGAFEFLNIAFYNSDEVFVEGLKSKGVSLVCTSSGGRAQSLRNFNPSPPLCLVIGGERRGIKKSLIENADSLVKIDCLRGEFSLSAFSASSILIYAISEKLLKAETPG